MKLLKIILCLTLLLSLTACGALHTTVAKRHLDVQTRMSSTIFLEPVDPQYRTIFVDIRNTSDKPEFDVRAEVIANLRSRGYQVIDSPSQANYWLQANVLQVGRSNARDSQGALAAGHGAVGGAVTGAVIHRSTGGSVSGTAGAAVAGAAVGTIVDAMVQDVYYSVITDIQVMERFAGKVQETSEHTLLQGDSGATRTSFSQQTNMRRYQTRIVSSANQANLKWEDAAPLLSEGVARALAGLF